MARLTRSAMLVSTVCLLPIALLAAAPAADAATSSTSTRWAGYAATRTAGQPTFGHVESAFVVPKVTCSASGGTQRALVWVGLGGFHAGDPAYRGGIAIACSGTTPHYVAQWDNTQLAASTHPVRAGESATVVVENLAASKQIRITLAVEPWSGSGGRPWTWQKTLSRSASEPATAECLVERPPASSGSGTLARLARFSPVTFGSGDTSSSGCVATNAGTGTFYPFPSSGSFPWGQTRYRMVNSAAQTLAAASVPTVGANPKVTWKRSS